MFGAKSAGQVGPLSNGLCRKSLCAAVLYTGQHSKLPGAGLQTVTYLQGSVAPLRDAFSLPRTQPLKDNATLRGRNTALQVTHSEESKSLKRGSSMDLTFFNICPGFTQQAHA